MRNPPNHIFDHTPDSLRDWFTARGLPPFRAAQVLDWLYQKGVADPAHMSNLSKRERDLLSHPTDGLTFLSGDTIAHQLATDGTQKLLIQWDDFTAGATAATVAASPAQAGEGGGGLATPGGGAAPASVLDASCTPGALRLPLLSPPASRLDTSRQTECVMIPAVSRGSDDESDAPGESPWEGRTRRTACISSQVGCPVGCRFCASGIGGWDANLNAGRIIEQVWRLRSVLGTPALRAGLLSSSSPSDPPSHPAARSAELPRITNVVFMGMGEPLSNFQAVTKAIRTLTAPWGLGISARKITISTVGLPKAIEKLAAEFDLPVTLALSLHAPNDELRRELIPWAEYTTIPELLAACQKWFEKTGREITLEYILLGGVNDQREHARQLAQLARTLRANVNLIRYNEVKGMPFARPDDQDVLTFQKTLLGAGVNTHIRASRGRDIAAACGQLRHEKQNAQPAA